MKLLLVTLVLPQAEAPGGMPLVLYAEILELVKQHKVTLLTLCEQSAKELVDIAHLKSLGVEVYTCNWQQHKGLELWKRRVYLARNWLFSKRPWHVIVSWKSQLQQLLNKLLTSNNYDLILVEDNAVAAYNFPTKTPIILTEHEVRHSRPIKWSAILARNWREGLVKELDWQRWKQYQAKVWSRFNLIQVFTPYDQDAIRAILPGVIERVRVNPFGIDIPKEVNYSSNDAKIILFIGNFWHWPNADAAVWLATEIMPLLRPLCQGVKLMLVGGNASADVRALAAEDIILTGRVPEVAPYIEQAAVIVAPVRVGGGQRVKVLQGMAYGKAVVTTGLGAQGLAMAGKQPPLVIADTAADIAKEVTKLLDNTELRKALGVQARAYVSEHYSTHAYAQRLEAVYAEVMEINVHS